MEREVRNNILRVVYDEVRTVLLSFHRDTEALLVVVIRRWI